jgi:hypothetical protein
MHIIVGERPREKIKRDESSNKEDGVASNHYCLTHVPKKIERWY